MNSEAAVPGTSGGGKMGEAGIDLRISRSLELLASLRETASRFAKREEELVRDLGARRYAVNRKYWDANEEREVRLAAELAATESHFKTEEERVRKFHEIRRARIQRVHGAVARLLPGRVHEVRGEWLGNLQVRQLDAERARKAGIKIADATLADWTAKLAALQADNVQCERRARVLFSGYPALMRLLRQAHGGGPGTKTESAEPGPLFEELGARLQHTGAKIGAFARLLPPRIFRYFPLPAPVMLIVLGGLAFAFRGGFTSAACALAGGGAAVLLALVWALHRLGLRRSMPAAQAVVGGIAEANRLHDACAAAVSEQHANDRRRIQSEFERISAAIRGQWDRADEVEAEFEKTARTKTETQLFRVSAKSTGLLCLKLARIESGRATRAAQIQSGAAARKQLLKETHKAETAEVDAVEKSRWNELESAWQHEIVPIHQAIDSMNAAMESISPAWDARTVETWSPPASFATATKFARIGFDLTQHADALPKDPRLALPGPAQRTLPVALTFPDHASLLFETNEQAGAAAAGVLNNIILRLLATTPPGRIRFTVIDPVGLGQNFAGLMHLADYEESLINRQIWTQRDQIEERLAELSAHIEKVIQMYLRNEYATITEYNAQAGSVAEKYHFLVVADFPAHFSETAARRLQSIAASGARCGIFTLLHWDRRQPLPDGFVPDDLRKNSVRLLREKDGFVLENQPADIAVLVPDAPPDPDLAVALVHKIGAGSIDSDRVQVPFEQVAPKPAEMWAGDTTNELKIAIGRTGATKLQYLAIGKGTRQHALFAGKTGSGKSTLFHVIITNLALACSPDQVEFYLIDFKKGVEFKCYATKRLPHARVIAIESDREFGLSVLQRVDEELKRRGELFRKLGVQDVAGYKKAGGTEPMPRSLLLVDEFQEFFVDDDTIAQTASLLFDRIVRQGRAFGIHVILGSQTLGGAYSLARATLGQMVIRVALQCNEADAYLIMDDNNSAPRLLSRPGEGIYNDAAGATEGNSPFQVVWLPDDERDVWLDKVRALAEKKSDRHPSPIVFEGNAPAEIRENDLLFSVLDSAGAAPPAVARAWLGAPNSIKGPTEAVFHRQGGNHLLIVGQRDEAALTMLGVSLLALAAQHPVGGAKFVFIHSANPGSQDAEFIGRIVRAIPHEVTLARGQEVEATMNALAAEMKSRGAGEQTAAAPPVFVFIHGLQKFKKLRHEDDFSFSSGSESGSPPGAQLHDLICEGSSLGMHLLVSVDAYNNVNRFLSRKALSEFEMRVVFQMGVNDSASLIDSPKASALGLHRALFYNEREGSLETFRPYATPDAEWIGQAAEKLARHRTAAPRFNS